MIVQHCTAFAGPNSQLKQLEFLFCIIDQQDSCELRIEFEMKTCSLRNCHGLKMKESVEENMFAKKLTE